MSHEPAWIARSGRRTIGYIAASVALLLGSWAVLRVGKAPTEEPPPPPAAEPAVARLPAENLDTSRRALADFDEDKFRVAAAGIPADVVEARIQAIRERPPAPPPDPAIMATAAAELTAQPVAMAALADALDARRSALRRACSPRDASPTTLFITTSFGADGGLREHSVTDDGAAPEVAECVHKQLASLKIAAPGVAVMTRAKLELP